MITVRLRFLSCCALASKQWHLLGSEVITASKNAGDHFGKSWHPFGTEASHIIEYESSSGGRISPTSQW